MDLTRVVLTIFLAVCLPFVSELKQQPTSSPTPSPTPPATSKKIESAIQWLLRFAGITLTSSRQKGENNDDAGTIWIADLVTGESKPLSYGDKFRWPIFLPCDSSILALRDNDVVKLSLLTNEERVIVRNPKMVKLVGADSSKDNVLVIVEDSNGLHRLGTLSLSSGQISIPEFEQKPVPQVQGLTEEALALSIAASSEREQGALKVSVETIKEPEPWTDVWLSIKKSSPLPERRNLSFCNKAKCGQPSISIEGRYVAYIKSPR
jgi:hypothetical protein